MRKILISTNNVIKYCFIFYLFFVNYSFMSMYPNAYQYEISKTDLKTRPMYGYNMPFIDAQMEMPLHNDQEQGATCYIIAMSAQSIDNNFDNNNKELYNSNFGCSFAINRKSDMLIAGDDTNYTLSRDIRAEFIGGSDDTVAHMSLLGKQNINGFKVLMQFPLKKINHFFQDWFLSLRTSIVKIDQQLKMILDGNPFQSLQNIRNFFANTVKNAKIDSELKSNTGIENITLSLDGIYKNRQNTLEIYYYTGIEIPTNFSYSSPYLFYPIIGNNGNIGLLLGADIHAYFHTKAYYRVGFLCEIENHFSFYKTINRTFDLFNQIHSHTSNAIANKNKPWSRYLPALSLKYPDNKTVVADISTLPVRMHECNMLDVSFGLTYNMITRSDVKYYFAGGYNLWMSQSEYLELQDRVYPEEYHNFYTYAIQGSLPDTSSSQTTIASQLQNDDIITNFNINNLDYGSVSSDGGYSQSLFIRGTIINCAGATILLGGWYEIGKKKMIPSRAGFWIGGGIEF